MTADGLLIDRSRSSPNFGSRAADYPRPDCIVLHYTGMRDADSAIDWLCDPASQVSCHYVVREDGVILQLVDEAQRAWHAGRSFWAGVTDLNSASIGIEIVNGGHDYDLPPFSDRQIRAVIALCREIIDRYEILPERVLAHSDIAPSRKRDPGERFPWRKLHEQGVGHWVAPVPGDGPRLKRGDEGEAVAELQEGLADYGYGLAVTGGFDAETETVVRAFQRRFRPLPIDGIADGETRATLAALLAARLPTLVPGERSEDH